MKLLIKFLIISTLFFGTSYIQAQPQSITIGFQADSYGEQKQLDSIVIVNRNKGCDTTIYYPDTSFTLYYFVGVNSYDYKSLSKLELISAFPNPSRTGKTEFAITVNRNKSISMMLTNMFGKSLLTKRINLLKGKNNFKLILPGKGVFLLTVTDNRTISTQRIICINTNFTNQARVLFKSHTNIPYKSRLNSNNWSYTYGDTLWYIGYAKTLQLYYGSDVIEDKPNMDTTMVFNIVEGIPCKDPLAVKYAGKLYQTVEIKNRCWLKENLNIGIKINGDSIMNDNGIIEKYCYDNKESNCDEYGGLYQWDEMMQYTTEESAQGICPDGWHIPSIDEWNTMTNGHSADDFKEYGNNHWAYGGEGTNALGLTVLPAGGRKYNSGTFQYLTKDAPFYSSTKAVPPIWGVYFKEFGMASITVWGNVYGTEGFAVRCIKDQ